ncbi:MAG TPA: PAS domain-containing protein [Oscillospiraceae bacterium]|jgi:PAS domain S-box-containing protein|nr:PAS domain-containing protein [Oscillospiraceae bacterium]
MEIYDTVISYTLWIIHKIILKGEIEIYSVSDDDVYEVDFMNLVVDKADGLKVVDCDNHFCEFTGVHPSKIKQGKLFLHDIIKPIYREEIMRVLCKKNSPYVYFDAEFVDKDENEVFIHCTGQNYEESSLCRLTLADVSKSQELQLQLRKKAKEMNYLIDLVTGGVCLFKVTSDMHIEVHYLNEGACRIFGTTKQAYAQQIYRLDELIHPDDKSKVFQAIGKAMATDGECDLEIRTIVHKNEYKWCKFNAAIQKYDEDNTPIFHAMITDITRIKEAEEEADKMSDMLVEMFKNLPDPIFCTDTQDIWQLQIVSEDFIKFLGFTRFHIFEEHKGRLDDFVSEREAKFIEAQIKKQIAEGKSTTVSRYSVRTKSGRFIVVEDRRKLVRQADGSYSMICRLKNVTNTYSEMF